MRQTLTGMLLLIALIIITLCAGCGGGGGGTSQGVTVSGTVNSTAGGGLSGVTVLLMQNTLIAGQTLTDVNGTFAIRNISPGTYLPVVRTLNVVTPVDVVLPMVTVTSSNITLPQPILVPTTTDLQSVTPSSTLGTLVVFARDQNGLPIPATLQVSGVGTIGLSQSPIVVNNIPVTSSHDVLVLANSQSRTFLGVPFAANTITVLNAVFTGPIDRFTVQGNVTNTLGGTLSGSTVLLFSNGTQIAQTTTGISGNFTFANLSPGTYTLQVPALVSGMPVRVASIPFTLSSADVIAPPLVVPVATDLLNFGAPVNGALLVFVRDEIGQFVLATVQIPGVTTPVTTSAPVEVMTVPAGTRTVTVTVNGIPAIQVPFVPFLNGVITVLNVPVTGV
ncbi:MAG TPA: carboxypeptidase-like regulatory domain-containing protein [Armatimonadota bacterium]|jgi:hypothetical protein